MKRSMIYSLRVACVGVALVASGVGPQAALYAQESDRCVFLCAPELKIEPTWTVEFHVDAPELTDWERKNVR